MGTIPVMPRFLLAKYAPDLSRMEPRNIGVILWTPRAMSAKFLSLPEATFVADAEEYCWWVKLWQTVIEKECIKPRRGPAVSRNLLTSIDALLTLQEDNYLLVDAGELLVSVSGRNVARACESLFEELVKPLSHERDPVEAKRSLARGCNELIDKLQLRDRPDFRTQYAIPCNVFGVRRELKYAYAIAGDKPQLVCQRTLLRSEQSVNSAALTLHAAAASGQVDREHCVTFMQASDVTTEVAEEGLEQLRTISTVIDITSRDAAEQFRSLLPKVA